jgi:uncharacterized membrane protein (UPF0127 family)
VLVKNLRLVGACLVAGIILVLTLLSGQKQPAISTNSRCGPYRTDKVIQVGSQQITAEVAASSAEQAKGLGGRPCIEANQGMLFMFDEPSSYSIWMKDTHFPIDIVWIGPDYRAVAIEVNVSPSTYPDRFVNKDKPAQYILELQVNRARSLGIDLGTPINF